MGRIDLEVLHAQLERWAAAHHHEGVTVSEPEVMPGHAGLSIGFQVRYSGPPAWPYRGRDVRA